MNFWDRYSSWEEAEAAWEAGARAAERQQPRKVLKVLPQVPGITPETARFLKWKSLKYMVTQDPERRVRRHFLRHPFRYTFRYLRSLVKGRPYVRDGDFFLFGFPSIDAFERAAKQKRTLILVGFSYCQKPLECPSGRFTDQCIRDPAHPICRQCPIAKVLHALPADKTEPLLIPTVHYIGEKVFEWLVAQPEREILFLITACELTLEMFGDLGHMAGVRGMGIRLDGRICNTLRAFELSEGGIKPGLTLLTPTTEARLLALIKAIKL